MALIVASNFGIMLCNGQVLLLPVTKGPRKHRVQKGAQEAFPTIFIHEPLQSYNTVIQARAVMFVSVGYYTVGCYTDGADGAGEVWACKIVTKSHIPKPQPALADCRTTRGSHEEAYAVWRLPKRKIRPDDISTDLAFDGRLNDPHDGCSSGLK